MYGLIKQGRQSLFTFGKDIDSAFIVVPHLTATYVH